jgi:DNA-binding transcriptional MerR regulator
MTNDERKQIIRNLLAEGQTLSQIQDYLRKEKDDSITYMELRLLLSEMPDTKLPEKEQPKTPIVAPAATTPTPEPAGKLSISVDQMPPPGAMLSGYVRFASGAKAHWFIDEMGRLGLEPELGSGKPTQEDMKEFSIELRRMLQQSGG